MILYDDINDDWDFEEMFVGAHFMVLCSGLRKNIWKKIYIQFQSFFDDDYIWTWKGSEENGGKILNYLKIGFLKTRHLI